MGFLQQIYIWVLNPTYGVTSKIEETKRNKIIAVCFFLITVQSLAFTAFEKQGIFYGYDRLLIIGAVLFCIATIFSVKGPLEKVKWNPIVYVPWFICFLWMIITGFHHNINPSLMFFAGLMLIVFPCFYFVWNNRQDYEVLFKLASKSIVVATAIYYIINFLVAPHTPGLAYYGIAVNPNSVGLAGIAGSIAALYLTLTENKRWPYIIVAGISASFIYLSLSRASVIAVIMVIIVFMIVAIRHYSIEERDKYRSAILIGVVVVSMIISIVGSGWILEKITPYTHEKISEMFLTESYADDGETINPLMQKFNKGDDLASLSSGRTVIWEAYIRELNFIGNDRTEALFVTELGHVVAAHNTYLEIGYRCGILAGLLYAWIAIYAAIYSFKTMFKKKSSNYKYALIPMAVMAFGVLSNLERALFPFEKVHILLFFIVLAPMFVKSVKEKSLD